MEQSRWTYFANFAAGPASVREARLFVCGLLRAHGLGSIVDDAGLVVNELAANAVTHARTPFVVTVQRDGSQLLLTVEDGASERPSLAKAGETEARGRGLEIVSALSQDWGSHESPGSAKSVWASLTVPA